MVTIMIVIAILIEAAKCCDPDQLTRIGAIGLAPWDHHAVRSVTVASAEVQRDGRAGRFARRYVTEDQRE